MLVLVPCSHRRGGAESLINTAVTRVKPPETCATFCVPPLRVYVIGWSWVRKRRLALTQTTGESVHFPGKRRESGLEACGRLCTYCGPPSKIFHRGKRRKSRGELRRVCPPGPSVWETEDLLSYAAWRRRRSPEIRQPRNRVRKAES